MAEDMKKKEEEMQKMKAEFDAANEILAAYKDKEAEMMKKEKKMKKFTLKKKRKSHFQKMSLKLKL